MTIVDPTTSALWGDAENAVNSGGWPDASTNQFYVAALDTSITLSSDVMYNEDISLPTFDATADFYIPVDVLKDIFQFSTTDLNLPLAQTQQDLHFYIQESNLHTIDSSGASPIGIANANVSLTNGCVLTGNTSADGSVSLIDGQQNIATDFIQSLSYKVFGSGLYDTLFNNAGGLQANAMGLINVMYHSQSMGALHNESTTSEDISGPDQNGYRYKSDNQGGICRDIFSQMISRFPERFETANGMVQLDSTEAQPLPFLPGDSIVFAVVMSPANQILNVSKADLEKKYLYRFLTYDAATAVKIPEHCGPLGCVLALPN